MNEETREGSLSAVGPISNWANIILKEAEEASAAKLETRKIAMVIVGILLVLAGVVFALQGDGVIGGSMMSGDSTYIYVGIVVAIIGLILLAMGFMSKSKMAPASSSATTAK